MQHREGVGLRDMDMRNSDRRQGARTSPQRRWPLRSATLIASAALATLALLNAGVDPSKWDAWIHLRTRPAVQPMLAKLPPTAPRAVLPDQHPANPDPLPGNNSSVSASTQQLTLTGTVRGRSFREGYAMLGVSRANPQTYAAGALLANGARLTEVHDRYVVLERGGRSARLYLEGGAPQTATRGQSNEVLSVGGEKPSAPTVSRSVEPVTDYLRPTPVYSGEVLTGYQVYPGSKSAVFSQMGLQPGDVITAMVGAPLSDTSQVTEMFHDLVNGMALQVVVSRHGKSEQLTLDGALIQEEQERARGANAMSPGSMPVAQK